MAVGAADDVQRQRQHDDHVAGGRGPDNVRPIDLSRGSTRSRRRPSTSSPDPDLWGPERLAEHLGVSTRFVRRLVEERRIPFLKIGKFVRFNPSDVADWVDNRKVDASR